MAKTSDSTESDSLPFGAMERPAPARRKKRSTSKKASSRGEGDEDGEKKPKRKRSAGKDAEAEPRATPKKASKKAASKKASSGRASGERAQAAPEPEAASQDAPRAEGKDGDERGSRDWRKAENRRGQGKRGGRRRRRRGGGDAGEGREDAPAGEAAGRKSDDGSGGPVEQYPEERRSRRSRRRGRRSGSRGGGGGGGNAGGGDEKRPVNGEVVGEIEGIVMVEKANHAHIRSKDNGFVPKKKDDVHVSPRFVQKFHLSDGAFVRGSYGRGHGKHRYDLVELLEVDGVKPQELGRVQKFKSLTSIDPDFHYAMGDLEDDVDLRVVDLICPVGRGQRGLIVAPPRSGKTILLQKMAKAIERHYEDVELMVLLVDERPEEATEWRRSVERGQVFVSTNDEMARRHVDLAETVWKRCQRLVELGRDVFLVIDSITRLARAYNNLSGSGGKTMSGGVDTRALERPKQFFGSARNTETAGSLTILGTTLIETGSRMDQVIFEEFKGTGNMELVLSRKLADRRIFPAIDIQRSGTRKEEKLISSRKLRLVHTLRRVLMRMSFIEAMELLVTKLSDVSTSDEFLSRFEIDPEA